MSGEGQWKALNKNYQIVCKVLYRQGSTEPLQQPCKAETRLQERNHTEVPWDLWMVLATKWQLSSAPETNLLSPGLCGLSSAPRTASQLLESELLPSCPHPFVTKLWTFGLFLIPAANYAASTIGPWNMLFSSSLCSLLTLTQPLDFSSMSLSWNAFHRPSD